MGERRGRDWKEKPNLYDLLNVENLSASNVLVEG